MKLLIHFPFVLPPPTFSVVVTYCMTAITWHTKKFALSEEVSPAVGITAVAVQCILYGTSTLQRPGQ